MFFEVGHQNDLKPKAVPSLQQTLLGCLPIPSSSKDSKSGIVSFCVMTCQLIAIFARLVESK